MSTQSQLRSQVVSRVVLAIILLAFLLYTAAIVLIVMQEPVPGELWLAAGNASGALFALLVNSKNDSAPQPVVGVPGGEPVAVEAAEVSEEQEPDMAPSDVPLSSLTPTTVGTASSRRRSTSKL